MGFNAAIMIPIEAEDQSQGAFDAVSQGFRNIAQEGQQLTQAFQQQSEQAMALRTNLADTTTAFDSLRTSTQSLFTGIQELSGGITSLSSGLSAQVESVQMLRTAYGELASQMMATRDAGAGMGSLGVGGTVSAGGGAALNEAMITGYDPTLDRATVASARAANTIEKTQGLIDTMYTPTPTEESPAASGGHGYSVLGQALQQSLVYGGLYAGYAGFKDSLGRDITYSQDLGTTQAMTGLSNAGINTLSNSVTSLAGSGTLPYSRDTLLQGDYSVASLGIGGGDAAKIAQVGQIIAQLSAAGGAPDTTQAGDALTSAISIYGMTNNPNVVNFAKQQADQLQTAVKLGKADFPDFAGQIGPAMAQGSQLGLQSSDIYAYLAAESAGGVDKGQLGQDLYSLEASTVKPTQMQQTAASSIGLTLNSSTIQQFGGLSGFTAMLQQRTAGLSDQQRESLLTGLFGNEAAAKGLNAVLDQPDYQSFFSGVQNSQGSYQAAFQGSQSTEGARLADASVRLQTSFDAMTTATLPALVKGMDALTTVFNDVPDIINNWGKKTPDNPAGGNPIETAAYMIGNAVTGGGWDPTRARNQAATGGYNTGYEYQFATDPQGFIKANQALVDNAGTPGGLAAFFAKYPALAQDMGYTRSALTQESVMMNGSPLTEAEFNAPGFNQNRLPTLPAGQYYTEGSGGNVIVRSFDPGGLGYNYTSTDGSRMNSVAPVVNIAPALAQSQTSQMQSFLTGSMAGNAPTTPGVPAVGGTFDALGGGISSLLGAAGSGISSILSGGLSAVTQIAGSTNPYAASAQQYVNNLNAGGGRGIATLDLRRAEDEVNTLLAQTPIDQQAVSSAMGELASVIDAMPGDPVVKNNTLIRFQQHVNQVIAQSSLKGLQADLTDLESQYKLDVAHGDTAGAEAIGSQIASFYMTNAAALGISQNTAAADALKYTTQQSSTFRLPTTPDQILIHPAYSGPGDALAGYESTTARLSQGGASSANPLAEMVRHLQQQVANQDKQIAADQKKIALLQELVDQGDGRVSTAQPMARNASGSLRRGGPLGGS